MALGLAYTAKTNDTLLSIGQVLSDDPVSFAESVLSNPGNAHITDPNNIPLGTKIYIGGSYALIKPTIRAAFEGDEQRKIAVASMTPEQKRNQAVEPYVLLANSVFPKPPAFPSIFTSLLPTASPSDGVTSTAPASMWNWKTIGLAAAAIWFFLR